MKWKGEQIYGYIPLLYPLTWDTDLTEFTELIIISNVSISHAMRDLITSYVMLCEEQFHKAIQQNSYKHVRKKS